MSSLRLDRAVAGDVAAAASIVMALESLLYGQTTYSLADAEDEWSELDVEQDAFVVREGGRILGCGLVRERGELCRVEGYVHPNAFGHGVGRLIATALEETAGRSGAARIQNSVMEADGAARRLLESLGYAGVRVFREMRIHLEGQPPAPEWPAGLQLGSFDPVSDAVAFHAAHQDGFTDHWDYTPLELALWSERHLASERFDPTLWCVVRAGDEIVGGTICTGGTYGGGWVHVLFTRRPWRRQGVGAGLLAESFRRLWAKGERSVGLGVDAASDTGALGVYERAGMTPTLGWVTYEKHLAEAA